MKKLIFMFFVVMLLVPSLAFAATFRASESETVNVSGTETLKNVYLAGKSVNIDGKILEDLYAAGNTVTVSSPVNGNANVAGNSVLIENKVGKSLKACGQTVTVNGTIGSDLLAGGQTINLGKNSLIADDVALAGATLELNGNVNGKAYLAGGQITINGTVGGDVIIKGSGKVTIGASAVIGGNLNYQASEQATIATGATIKGITTFTKTSNQTGPFASSDFRFTFFSFITTLAMFVLLLILIYVFPKTMKGFVKNSLAKFWSNLGVGFLFMVAVPAGAVLVLFTMVGMPTAFLVFGFYALALGLAKIFIPVITGSLIFKWLSKEEEYRLDWLTILVGLAATCLIGLIPVFGWLILFGLFLVSASQFALGAMQLIKSQR